MVLGSGRVKFWNFGPYRPVGQTLRSCGCSLCTHARNVQTLCRVRLAFRPAVALRAVCSWWVLHISSSSLAYFETTEGVCKVNGLKCIQRICRHEAQGSAARNRYLESICPACNISTNPPPFVTWPTGIVLWSLPVLQMNISLLQTLAIRCASSQRFLLLGDDMQCTALPTFRYTVRLFPSVDFVALVWMVGYWSERYLL
jgi:hypothetical protein